MSGIERVCISVNSVCNLKCSYCYFFLQPSNLPGRDALSEAEIGTILERVAAYGDTAAAEKGLKVNFVGSGEPLMEWSAIRGAIDALHRRAPEHRVRFYTVTNGLLLTPAIAAEMRAVGISPSVSLDGPAFVHDATRVRHNGRGSHAAVMRGIDALRSEGIPVAVNVTLTREVIANLEAVLDFVDAEGITKLIFGRLVDVPEEFAVPTAEYYAALARIAEIHEARGLEHIEIGNLEAYRRALAGTPDRVCTMFGSTCGSGFHNIIYMQRDVYPCGRMVGQDRWKLGRFDEPLDRFPERMAAITGRDGCGARFERPEDGPAGPDCLIERSRPEYDGGARDAFVGWLAARPDRLESLGREP